MKTMKKFLTTLLAATFVLTLACGKGKEVTKAEDEGEDDQQAQTTTTAEGTTTAPAATPAAAPAAVADAATLTGTVKFAGAAPAMPNIQMNADPYCQSQHATPAKDEEVVVGPGGELANVLVYIKNAPAGAAPSTARRHRPARLPVPSARAGGRSQPAHPDQEQRRHAAQHPRHARP